jgi:hypothetical protein
MDRVLADLLYRQIFDFNGIAPSGAKGIDGSKDIGIKEELLDANQSYSIHLIATVAGRISTESRFPWGERRFASLPLSHIDEQTGDLVGPVTGCSEYRCTQPRPPSCAPRSNPSRPRLSGNSRASGVRRLRNDAIGGRTVRRAVLFAAPYARSAGRLRFQSLMQLNIRRQAWCILFRACKRGGYHDRAFPTGATNGQQSATDEVRFTTANKKALSCSARNG